MKGLVFNLLEEMVLEQHGMGLWEQLLEDTGLDGVFTSADTYPDPDLFALVKALEDLTDVPASQLLRAFGQWALPQFHQRFPELIEPQSELFDYLKCVDETIHMEVLKLFPEAVTPRFIYHQLAADTLLMEYHSERKLCQLAVGLIESAAQSFGKTCHIEHQPCMHDGADHCGLKITVSA